MPLRESTPGGGDQRASFGFPSNRQISRPDAASYPRSQPSPPPNSTCVRPFTLGGDRAAPLAVQHVLAGADRTPDHVARLPVHRDQAWRPRRGDARVSLVAAVGRGDEQQVPDRQHLAVRASCTKTPRRAHRSSSQTMSPARVRERLVLLTPRRSSRRESPSCPGTGAGTRPSCSRAGRRRRTVRWSSREAGTPSAPARPAGRGPAKGTPPSPPGTPPARRNPPDSRVPLPRVVGPDVDHAAGHHGPPERFAAQLDAPYDVPPGDPMSQSTGGFPSVRRGRGARRRRAQRDVPGQPARRAW